MINYFLLVVIPNLDCLLSCLGIMGMMVAFVLGLILWSKMSDASCDKEHKECWVLANNILKILIASMFIFFITCFIPSKKDMLQLKVISIVSELQGVEKIPQKVIDRLNDLLGDDKENTEKQ